MKKSNLSLVILLSLVLSSCDFIGNCLEGEGEIITEELSLDNFHSLRLQHPAKVFLKQSKDQRVSIKAQQNVIDLLKTEVKNEEWRIDFQRCIKANQKVEIYISIPDIQSIEIHGSGDVLSKEMLKGDEIDLTIAGSGSITLGLDVKEISTEIDGSGDLTLSGSAKSHEIEINGSGDIAAFDLITDDTEIEINGSGDVKARANYKLDVEINGSGDVYYKGGVKEINSEINGSGELHQE